MIAAPLGSFLGGLIGWRNVFNGAAVMGVLCTLWVLKALPSLPGESAAQQQNMFGLLKRPGVMAGMCAIFHGLCRTVLLLYLYSTGIHDTRRF